MDAVVAGRQDCLPVKLAKLVDGDVAVVFALGLVGAAYLERVTAHLAAVEEGFNGKLLTVPSETVVDLPLTVGQGALMAVGRLVTRLRFEIDWQI